MRQLRKRRNGGFTLLELVIVLIIIATIAGLVIPQLGFLGRSADMAATAKNQADIANQLSLYFVLQKRMPQRLDSLLTTTGSTFGLGVIPELDGAGAATTIQNDQRWGFPISGANGINLGSNANLIAGVLPASPIAPATTPDPKRSFTRLGFDFLMDHDTTVGNSNNSGVIERALSSTTIDVATVVEGSPLARQLYPNPTTLFPAGGDFPADVGLVVAVGVGPNSSLVPGTMLNVPAYPGSDGSYYGRYIAYFACFNSGERAQLIGVSDAYGRFPNYSQQQFSESLPNNGRQG